MALKNIFNKHSLRNALGVAGTAAALTLTGAAIVGGSFLTVPLAAASTVWMGYATVKGWKQPKL